MPAASKSNKNNSLNAPRASRSSSSTSVHAVPATAQEDAPATDGRCQHLRADGKRCASANYPGHTSLCHHHLNQQMRGIAAGNIIAADILSSIGNFQSGAAINIALGKIFVHQITGRISRQDALSLLYNCQLLLQTLPAVKTELRDSGYIKYWNEATRRILSGPSDLDAVTDVALLPDCSYTLHPPDCTPAEAPSPAPPAPPQTSNAVTPAVTPQPTSTPQTSPVTSTSSVPAAAVANPPQTSAPQTLNSPPRSSSAANDSQRDSTSTTPPE